MFNHISVQILVVAGVPMQKDPITETTSTYDQIATNYADRWQDRGLLEADMQQFADLLPSAGLVCDVGCGPGFDTAVLRQKGIKAIGLDRSWGMMQAGRVEHGIDAPFVQVDMRALPLGKTAVSGLWVSASLLHLPRADVPVVLQNFAYVLQPNGILYLSVKLGDDAKWMPALNYEALSRFFTYWQPKTLDPLLAEAGLDIIDGWQRNGRYDRWLVRLARRAS